MEANNHKGKLEADQRPADEDTNTTSPEETPVPDRSESGMPEKHHQEHGNRKYKMFRNESAADNHPRTDTGTP